MLRVPNDLQIAQCVISPTKRLTLSLIDWEGEKLPVVRDVVVNPYTGPALAYAIGDTVVAVGPLMGQFPREELVVSAALRFAARCKSQP